MASSTLNSLTGVAPALSDIFYHVISPFGSGDDRKCTGQQLVDSFVLDRVIYKQGIPMIYASSGTMTGSPNGNGAFTGLTTLTGVVPSRALLYFPANAVATVSAAGWYFCTLSSSTAGNVIDTTPYTPSGTPPVWPASPTTPTTASTWTSGTGSVTAMTFDIPASALSANGMLEFMTTLLNMTNNVNAKSVTLAFGALTTGAVSLASSGAISMTARVNNMTTGTNVLLYAVGTGFSAYTPVSGTVDTTASVTVTLTLTKGTATDNVGIWPAVFRMAN